MAEKIHFGRMTRTKYMKPEANRYLIPRQRLYKKLDNSLRNKLTLVTAPAGFGKTTAILEWLENREIKAAWLNIDARDNNPLIFWQYFCAALDVIVPGIFKDTEYVFRSGELLNTNTHINILIDRLMEVKVNYPLILDDFHLISNPVILNGIACLTRYLPPKMHLILTCRFEPDLELASLGIKTQLLRIGDRELRFKKEEIHRFYKTRGLILENDDIIKTENFTEGWAAALVAVAMCLEDDLNKENIIECFASTNPNIKRYLEDEVLRFWPEEKCHFSLKTAILDTLSASLCNAVTGEDNGRRILKEINERSGFLNALDSEGHEYRYHHLFKEFLYEQLKKTAPEDIPQLHTKAASWYEEQGDYYQAIEHYLSGTRYEEALKLIETQVESLCSMNDYSTLFSWIDRLPEVYKTKSFKTALAYALYYAENNNFPLSREWIKRMDLLAADKKYTENPELGGYIKASCNLSKANLFIREGKVNEFFSAIKKAGEANKGKFYMLAEYMDVNSSDIYFYRCPYKTITYMFAKKRDEYWEMVNNYREMISSYPGYAYLAAGEYLYENNMLTEALHYLLKTLEEARKADCPGAFVPVMVDIARIKKASGNTKGALEALDECEKWLQSTKTHWTYLINAMRTRLYLDSGDREKADRWFDSCRISIYTDISRIREFELLMYARVLLVKGRLSDAELLLKRLLTFTEKMDRQHSKVEVLNLLSILSYRKKELPMVMNHLEESLVIGRQESYLRSYLDEGETMIPLLRYYAMYRRRQEDNNTTNELIAFAKGLMKQAQSPYEKGSKASSASKNGLEEPLTGQEKNVLALLLEAHSNKEIAQELGISIWTVKTHLKSIYSKLEAKNRIHCLKLAREMHLLD